MREPRFHGACFDCEMPLYRCPDCRNFDFDMSKPDYSESSSCGNSVESSPYHKRRAKLRAEALEAKEAHEQEAMDRSLSRKLLSRQFSKLFFSNLIGRGISGYERDLAKCVFMALGKSDELKNFLEHIAELSKGGKK
jgi:hypothetical protein